MMEARNGTDYMCVVSFQQIYHDVCHASLRIEPLFWDERRSALN